MRSFGRVFRWLVPLLAVQWGCQMGAPSRDSTDKAQHGAVVAYLSSEGDPAVRDALLGVALDAAKARGYEMIARTVSTPEQVLAGLDEVGAQGAKGVLVGTTDPRLGPAILQKAEQYGMKLVAVEERLVDDQGQPLKDVPFVGVNAPQLGTLAAQALISEMKARSWRPEDVNLLVVVRNTHRISRGKTEALIGAMENAGVPQTQTFRAATSIEVRTAARKAVEELLPRISRSTRWLVAGPNDATVMGALDALQGSSVKSDQVIGVGIGGGQPNRELGFVASVPVPTRELGEQAVAALISWVKEGKAPQTEVLIEGSPSAQ